MAVLPDQYAFVEHEVDVPSLQGALCEPQTHLLPNMDVCVYADPEEATSLPWLGRVLEVYPETMEFLIQWYKVDRQFCSQNPKWPSVLEGR